MSDKRMHPFLISGILFLASYPVSRIQAGPVEDLDAWLKTARAARPALASQAFASTPLTAAQCAQAKDLIWTDRLNLVKSEWASQWTGKILVDKDGFKMPFDYRIYGAKPAKGYDLYISMHGGGATTKAENDGQWQNQILLYQPNGIYLAPRAPTDAFNMWHKDHIDGFFDQIIQLCVANLGANANRVYVMGYSAGGDGAYQMAPRMADRWAASAMMAGYPNNASPINLRNIGFTMHVGGLDAAYGRNTICVTYGNAIQKLQDADPGFYKYDVQVHAGKPHWMDLEDKVALDWTYKFTRDPFPAKVVWRQDTTVGTNLFPASGPVIPVKGHPTQYQFYWIGLQETKPLAYQADITAAIDSQDVEIRESNVDSLLVLLNDSLLNLDKPVRVRWKGALIYQGTPARTIANLYRTVQDRGDRDYAFPAVLRLKRNMQVSLAADQAPSASPSIRVNGGHIAISLAKPGAASVRLLSLSGTVIASVESAGGSEFSLPYGNPVPGLYIVSVRAGASRTASRIFLP
ncbi:MAG: hypothetical protein JWP91_2831 [Fibrobacteres bacterium]|nr:hypothetical protein [Fibrobacterota bacterium]